MICGCGCGRGCSIIWVGIFHKTIRVCVCFLLDLTLRIVPQLYSLRLLLRMRLLVRKGGLLAMEVVVGEEGLCMCLCRRVCCSLEVGCFEGRLRRLLDRGRLCHMGRRLVKRLINLIL